MVATLPILEAPTPLSLAQAPIPQEDHERKRAMKEAWKAYRGEFKAPLKVKSGDTDDNVLSNRCEPIVNKGVSFLFGQVLKIEASDEAAQDAGLGSPIQDFLDGFWGDDDDRMTRLSQKAINGGVCGQVFVKLIPPQGSMKYPRMVIMDPQIIRIVTAPDDCTLHLAYVIEYPGRGDWQKRQIIARVDPGSDAEFIGDDDINDTWTITNYIRKGGTGTISPWLQVGNTIDWPYPFAPIITWQNLPNPNEPWGRSDLTADLIEQNKVLNFVQSNTSRIIKFHAHPKTWAKGVTASQIEVSVDEVICLPSMDSDLQNLEMRSDLRSSLSFIAVIRDNMDEQSRVPSVALGRLEALPRGSISGVALKLLFQPLIEKTVQKQRLYGSGIRAISRAALVLAGLVPVEQWEDTKIGLHWPNLLPIDDLLAAQTAKILVEDIGVSKTTVLQELGYSADEEIAKTAAEIIKKAQAGIPQAPALPPTQPPMPEQLPPVQPPPIPQAA